MHCTHINAIIQYTLYIMSLQKPDSQQPDSQQPDSHTEKSASTAEALLQCYTMVTALVVLDVLLSPEWVCQADGQVVPAQAERPHQHRYRSKS